MYSSWLNGPEFLKTLQWHFRTYEDCRWKLKKSKQTPSLLPVAESSSLVSATQSATAQTFQWQKFCSYEKLLRIAAYILSFSSRNCLHSNLTSAITDPAELELAEQQLFYIVQTEALLSEKCNLQRS